MTILLTLTQNIMKIYFDGCSNTWGAELQNPQQSRYSKLVCDYFGAEEYNIALRGGSNMRLARNILDHDLSEYDMFVIQFTHKVRGEWYDNVNNRWLKIEREPKDFDKNDERKKSIKQAWKLYHKEIYTDELGSLNSRIYYNLIKHMLKDKPLVTLGIEFKYDFSFGTKNIDTIGVPVDLRYKTGEPKKFMGKYLDSHSGKRLPRFPYAHPNEEGHKIIAEDVIKFLS